MRTLILLTATALLAVGCARKVELNFYNASSQAVRVMLTAPPEGTRDIGLARPNGKLKYVLKIDKDYLPADCSWESAGQSEGFVVAADTPGVLFFSIDAPRPANQPGRVPGPRQGR